MNQLSKSTFFFAPLRLCVKMIKSAIPLAIIVSGIMPCAAKEFIPAEPYWWHPNVSRDPAQRTSDAPFITSDSFRAAADFIFDETRIPFETDNVKDGDIIYVTTPYLDYFFWFVHPHIKARYILLTHFGDQCVPGPYYSERADSYWHVFTDEHLAYWIGMNVNHPDHPKMIQIPIGLAPKNINYPDFNVIADAIKSLPREKKYLLYLNHHDGTNPEERKPVRELFRTKSFCHIQGRKSFAAYFDDLASSKFVISPPGSGFDCYKTWEALVVGCIPIVKRSPIVALFDDLPVVIIDDWNEVTEDFLNKKYEEMSARQYNLDKLWFGYWLHVIQEAKNRVRAVSVL